MVMIELSISQISLISGILAVMGSYIVYDLAWHTYRNRKICDKCNGSGYVKK